MGVKTKNSSHAVAWETLVVLCLTNLKAIQFPCQRKLNAIKQLVHPSTWFMFRIRNRYVLLKFYAFNNIC